MLDSRTKMAGSQPPAKQTRMRKACNQCHAVKIRCSGEKTGCNRCQSVNLTCEYSVSMVGRTSKRSKRDRVEFFQGQQHQPPQQTEIKHQSAQPLQIRQQQEEGEEEDEEEEADGEQAQQQRQHSQHQLQHPPRQQQVANIDDEVRNTQLETFASDFAPTPNGSVTTWTGHFQSDPAAQGNITSVDPHDDLHHERQAARGTFSEGFPADFDFGSLNEELNVNQFNIPNVDDQNLAQYILANSSVSGPASPKNYEKASLQVPALVLSKSNMPQHELYSENCGQSGKYPHVATITRIIDLLEGHIQSSTIAIDELMHVNKTCIADLSRIMGLNEYAVCKSCSILVATGMELVITLYETVISGHRATSTAPDQQQRQLSSPASSSSGLSRETIPNLQFGVFHLDHEDQIAIRNRIISKQLKHSVEIIRSLGCDGSNGGKVHKQWYAEMEHRAKRLVSSMEEYYD